MHVVQAVCVGCIRRATSSRLARPGRLPGGENSCDGSAEDPSGNGRHVNLDMPCENTGNMGRIVDE